MGVTAKSHFFCAEIVVSSYSTFSITFTECQVDRRGERGWDVSSLQCQWNSLSPMSTTGPVQPDLLLDQTIPVETANPLRYSPGPAGCDSSRNKRGLSEAFQGISSRQEPECYQAR